jgi:hypothetical protein
MEIQRIEITENDRAMLSKFMGEQYPSELDYNWLMPVVEKIEQGNYGFKMCRKVVEIYFDDTKAVILRTKEKSRLESLYKAVVEFMLLNQPEPKES